MVSGYRNQARWRCETCKGELTMPAGFSEFAGYFCCYASMTYLGIESVPSATPIAGSADG
jgi:hypothetical protein